MSGAGAVDSRITELEAELSTIRLGEQQPLGEAGAILHDLLRLSCWCTYSVVQHSARIAVDAWGDVGAPPDLSPEFSRFVASSQPRFGQYDALRPDAWQHNKALTFADLERRNGPMPKGMRQLFERVGVGHCDQLRALICDGDGLLAWVGGFRERPFTHADRRVLQRVVPLIHRRLLLARYTEAPGLREAALCAALEAIPAEAYLIDGRARVVDTNELGRQMAAREGKALLEELQRALRLSTRTTRGEAGAFCLTRLTRQGLPAHYLAVRRNTSRNSDPLLPLARQRWTLTPRQTEVLGLLARGLSNRAISIALGCAEGTIQLRVAALLTKIGAESRAEVVARFWTELG